MRVGVGVGVGVGVSAWRTSMFSSPCAPCWWDAPCLYGAWNLAASERHAHACVLVRDRVKVGARVRGSGKGFELGARVRG